MGSDPILDLFDMVDALEREARKRYQKAEKTGHDKDKEEAKQAAQNLKTIACAVLDLICQKYGL